MKLAAALLSLAWLSACTFPDYDVDGPGASSGGSGANGGTGASGASGGTGANGGTDVTPEPSCSDGLRNADESDQDCGGEHGCDRCTVGQRCTSTSDCDGGLCTSGQCRAPTCKDGLINGAETDLDCGGDSCIPCKVGQACVETRDCDGVACSKQECQPAACDDQIWNQDETDQDCGGGCTEKCEDAMRCRIGADCQSGVCPKSLRCAAPACDDDVLNGDEPSVDCGGSCEAKCVVLDACNSDDDCADSSCIDKRCLPSAATGQVLSRLKWTARASHENSVNSTAAQAIDGNALTYWTTGATQALAMWFEIDMKTDQVFFSIEIDCARQADDFPDGVDVEFSSDGTYSGAPAKPNFATKTGTTAITFTKPQVARFIRFTLTQGKNKWWSIDELRVKQ
jgi:F5/8 type C domain